MPLTKMKKEYIKLFEKRADFNSHIYLKANNED
jgi:hypothetical protein